MLGKEDTIQLAYANARQGFLCSESVLLALSKCLNISSDLIPRIATGFGAGIGRAGEVCGAISGAVMGLGLFFGRMEVNKESQQKPYWFASELMKRFSSNFGQVQCKKLLSLDLTSEEAVEALQRIKQLAGHWNGD
ncbi:MAG: C-GCAxxG-C-C family protein, partial [Promethearchaeota archaeon]